MLRYFPKSQYNALPDMFVTVDLSKNLSQEIIGSAASTTLS